VEMLFLLSMCLRRGAYDGMYLAKMMHGAFALLAVAAVFTTLKRDRDSRARFSAALLATTPFVVYLSWLAMVELAVVFYLTLGVLWLREWIRNGSARSAWCVGLALGGSCAVKYLSVGFVVAPVAAVMLGLSGRGGRRVWHAVAAVLMAGALFSPWLIRNAIHTRNPVFPLATGLLGRGHWSAESEQRWVDGHSPHDLPPVPPPPGWRDPPRATTLERLFHHFIGSQWFGTLVMMTAGVGFCVLLAAGKQGDPWDWALVGIVGVQVAVWLAFTRGAPGRFILPAAVPVTLLAGGALAGLSGVKINPLRRKPPPAGPVAWGRAPAAVLFVAAAIVNLFTARNIYVAFTSRSDLVRGQLVQVPIHGDPGEAIASQWVPPPLARTLSATSRILLVGEARGFYFPPHTVYATVWDEHLLAEIAREDLSPKQTLRRLRERHVDYVWVQWTELWRLANTYGCAEPFSRELFARWQTHRAPGLKPLEALRPLGLKLLAERGKFPAGPYWDPKAPRLSWPQMSLYALPGAPLTALPTTAPATGPRADPTTRP